MKLGRIRRVGVSAVVLVGIAAGGTALSSAQAGATPAPTTGTVQGTLTAGTTTTGAAGVCANLEPDGTGAQDYAFPTPVSTTGAFTDGTVVPGKYLVYFSDCQLATTTPGYVSQYWQGATTYSDATPITVAAGGTVTLGDVSMKAAGGITGTVDKTGTTPLTHVCVEVYRVGSTVQGGAPVQTGGIGPAGRYKIDGLTPTVEYQVRFDTTPHGLNNATTCLGAPGTRATQWAGNVTERADSSTVSLTAGTYTTQTATLPAAGSVKGTVLGPTGRKPGQTEVIVYATGSTTAVASQYAAYTSGKFTMQGVAPGTYQVKFSPYYFTELQARWYRTETTRATATTVHVTVGTATTVSETLPQLTPATTPAVTAGSTYFTGAKASSVTFTSTGTPTPTLSETGGLPSGLSVTTATPGQLTISGTPSAATEGKTFPITITAYNGGVYATAQVTLTVSKVAPPPAPATSVSSASAVSTSPTGKATAVAGPTTTVTATGDGVGALTVATYTGNPTSKAPATAAGRYLDVAVSSGSSFTSLTLTVCTVGAGRSLDWWSGTAWAPFSTQAATSKGTCITATATSATSPTLAQLTGTVIAVSKAAPPAQTPPSAETGYDLVGADGGVFVFDAPGQTGGFYGSLPGIHVTPVAPIKGIVPTETDSGYFLVGADGGVFSFGNAPFLGSLPGIHVDPAAPIVGIVATDTDRGYFLVGADGGVFAFGTATFAGSLPGAGVHTDDVVGIAATPTGNGYWVVSATGTVTGFGAAKSMGTDKGTGSPVTAIAGTPNGDGYWITTANGGVRAFGTAVAHGTLPSMRVTPDQPVIGIVRTTGTSGYWLIGQDGGVFAFGTAPFVGSLPGLNPPVHVDDIAGAVPN